MAGYTFAIKVTFGVMTSEGRTLSVEHKADGMINVPELTRGMLTLALEQKVNTLGIKPTA